MKICPKCKNQYADDINFCLVDGTQLVNTEVYHPHNEDDNPHCELQADTYKQSRTVSSDESQYKPIKKSGGCLKKIIITVIVITIGVVALYRSLMNAATYLRLEPTSVTLSKGGGECRVDVDYDGYFWNLNHKPSWVIVSEGDSHFEISALANTTGNIQNGSITIQSGKLLAQVEVRQLATASFLESSESRINFGKSGGSETITIISDGAGWTAHFPDWIEVSNDGDDVVITSSSNKGDVRSGYVTFKEDYVSASIWVHQGGKCNACHGNGVVACFACAGLGGVGYGMYRTNCYACGGAGYQTCGTCKGEGEVE